MRRLINIVLFSWLLHTSVLAQSTVNLLEKADYITPYNVINPIIHQTTIRNPIIKGFYSDPSICKVGEDYFLATSTLEYFPGVPILHSKDLIHWEIIGHCITRREQMPMGLNTFAPSLRYHEGMFYLFCTKFGGLGGNYYMTAKNPAGPWSNPVWLEVRGIDPDIFFDDNGKTYLITSLFTIYEIDLQTGKILDKGKKIWYGNGGAALEGPHIYKKDGYYYLMAAEGGTAEGHRVTIARALKIEGPYIDNPSNPILANENAAGQLNDLHGAGHGDLIKDSENSWWIVFHAYRPNGGVKGIHHTLGRETCILPVFWPQNGWPIVNGNGAATLEVSTPTLPENKVKTAPSRTEFNDSTFDPYWAHIQIPNSQNYSLSERKGYLRLKGDTIKLGDNGSPTFIGKRLYDFNFSASTEIDFQPLTEGEIAGMTLVNNGTHFDILIKKEGKQRTAQVHLQFGKISINQNQ